MKKVNVEYKPCLSVHFYEMWVSKKYKKTKLNRKMCYREIEGFGYIYEVNFKKRGEQL